MKRKYTELGLITHSFLFTDGVFCLQCGRHDLLNRLYQAMGRWDDAVGVASSKDRINLKSTHYAHGRHLESVGDVSGAIRAYEKSGELLFIRVSFYLSFVPAIGLTDGDLCFV